MSNFFAAELRRARERAGLTQEQVAAQMAYSQSLYSQVEGGRLPSREFAERADKIFDADGLFSRIRAHMISSTSTPEWLRPWWELSQQASSLRIWHPLVVPGIVQIEDYARAQLAADDPDRTERLVTARRERQQAVFDQERPPRVTILVDELVLRRPVAPPEVMAAQLRALVDRGDIRIQVVPSGAANLGLDGAFEIACIDGRDVVYVETPVRGFVLDEPAIISDARERWETLIAEALPPRQSSELLRKVAKEWMA